MLEHKLASLLSLMNSYKVFLIKLLWCLTENDPTNQPSNHLTSCSAARPLLLYSKERAHAANMHASARGRAVSCVHLPALELSQGGGPPGGHPREPSQRRICLLAQISLDIRGICLTQDHHH